MQKKLFWLLCFYVLSAFSVHGEPPKSDCLEGASKSPIGEVLDSSSDITIDQQVEQYVPAELPEPSKYKLRGSKFILIQHELFYD